MKSVKKFSLVCVFVFILLIITTQTVYANSAEPPGLIMIVDSPPDDLTVSLKFEDGSVVELDKTKTAWEAQYRFIYGMITRSVTSLESATLIAAWDDTGFECALLGSMLNRYNNILTLDIRSQTVSNGQTFARSAALVSMRVVLTLIIEGIIFLAFQYRQKRSWLAFLIVNLITQGILNVALNQSFTNSYLILALVFYEILVFIAEAVALTAIIKEHKKGRTLGYVLAANLCSLVLGGFLISYLPV